MRNSALRRDIQPVDLVIVSDRSQNTTKFKYQRMFYIGTESYVVVVKKEPETPVYTLLKVVSDENGVPKLHDIINEDEFNRVHEYFTHHIKSKLPGFE